MIGISIGELLLLCFDLAEIFNQSAAGRQNK